MEFMLSEPQSNKSVHIEQMSHGKFVKISSTSTLLNIEHQDQH